MSQHHLPETVLTEYAAGSTMEPVSLIVASHITLCRQCRDTVELLDEVGGALLETIIDTDAPATETNFSVANGETVPATMLNHMLSEDAATSAELTQEQEDFLDVVMPHPLRKYVGRPIQEVPWRKLTGSLDVYDLLTHVDGYTTRLMRVARGAAMPRHTHDGDEYTLILQGGMTDHHGVYHRGDLALANPSVDHSPRALPDEDCLCLAVNASGVRLTGPIGRWLNRFVKF